MGIKETLDVINRMGADGVIGRYAGAVAACPQPPRIVPLTPHRRAKAIARKSAAVLLGILAAVASTGQTVSQEKNPSSNSTILTFEFALTLPDLPGRVAWSPDNRFLTVSQLNTGKVVLVDIASQRLSDQIALPSLHSPTMTWSSDGRFIALKGLTTLSLVSVSDSQEVARLKSPVQGCRFQHLPASALAFTPDNQSLWIGCEQRQVDSRYGAALKLRVPTLEPDDLLGMDPPLPDELVNNVGGHHIGSDNTSLVLTSRFTSCPSQKNIGGPSQCTYFVHGHSLLDKSPLFAAFAVTGGDNPRRWPTRAQISSDGKFAVVSWPPRARQHRRDKSDTRFETFTTDDGARLVAFGTPAERGKLHVSDFTLTPSGERVIAALHNPAGRGGLRVWEARTGALRQSLSTGFASSLRLSPDGTHLAVIMLDEIRIYRVAE